MGWGSCAYWSPAFTDSLGDTVKKIGNTNVKVFSKVRELETATAFDIWEDCFDYARAQTVANGTKISRQKGSRRIVDTARNKFAHSETDYSSFKVVKIETGAVIDPRVIEQQQVKKEQDLETEALALLADLGIDWSDDDSDDEDEDQADNNSDDQADEQPETQADEQVPADFDNLLTAILDNNTEEQADSEQDEQQEFTDRMLDQLIQQVTEAPKSIKKARTLADIKAHPYVDGITDERSYGDGIWVHIKEGFINKQLDCREIHEKTVAKCCEILNSMVVPVN